ncbi:MAG: winged helix-turn-helix domain-containing protein [Chloroflexi bacterium]|nr:winged helix-turn-helix domain-containing protein [Chloroflexota bacterium]
MTQELSLSTVRTLILHAQRLTSASPPEPTLDVMFDAIQQVLCLQIDTLQMVHRSHYVALWSRLGTYDPADLDRLAYDPEQRRLFEYWFHAACLIPLAFFPYLATHMARRYDYPGTNTERWLQQEPNQQIVARVYERVQAEGGLRAADFVDKQHRSEPWWGWKPAKRALEVLYNRGDLMVGDRVNFQRVYDIPDRVLPDWVERRATTYEQASRWMVEQSARAQGVAAFRQIGDYTHTVQRDTRPYLEALVEEGILCVVEADLLDGKRHDLLVHRDNLPLIEQIEDGEIRAERTTFLNPFDSLFYADKRDQQVWGFEKLIEMYKPQDQRIYGYYCLPILHHDRLVGRFDPKLDRKTGRLIIKALYLEPGVHPDDELVQAVAEAMQDFMTFHQATDLVIENSEPVDFGPKLEVTLAALSV